MLPLRLHGNPNPDVAHLRKQRGLSSIHQHSICKDMPALNARWC